MTTITFIMPTYNRAEFVGLSIDKVLEQIGPDDEFIVVDDGSTDATASVLDGYAPRIRCVRQSNSGKARAVNHGVGLATRDAVWICDDDDLLRPGAVEALRGSLASRPDTDIAFGRYSRLVVRNGEHVDLGTGYWPDLSSGSVARHELEDSFLMHNASLVRRTAYDRAGLHNESMLRSEDYDIFVRFALCCRFAFVDRIIYDQRQHEGLRGTGDVRHAASESFAVWQDFDQRLFERVDREVPLTFYQGLFASDDEVALHRAALLQRAVVMARKHMWSHALRDLEAAVDLAPDRALCAGERRVAARLLSGKYGFSTLEAADTRALRGMGRGSRAGRDVVAAAVQGTLWRLRAADPDGRDATRRLVRELGVARAIGSAVGQRLRGRAVDDGVLVERDHPARYAPPGILDPATPV